LNNVMATRLHLERISHSSIDKFQVESNLVHDILPGVYLNFQPKAASCILDSRICGV
jgi:hypothetical protein